MRRCALHASDRSKSRRRSITPNSTSRGKTRRLTEAHRWDFDQISLMPNVSPPQALLSARQTLILIVLLIKITDPSQKPTFSPPPACRLRAPIMRGRDGVDVSVHGGFPPWLEWQMPPVITSGSLLLGPMKPT